jgi:osmotically-inducible protein OsmY
VLLIITGKDIPIMTTRWAAGTNPQTRGQRICPVAEAAERSLRHSQYAALRQVTCTFHEGRLSLHGRLPSFYLVQIAQALVGRLPGVQQVENRIQVTTSCTPHDHRPPETELAARLHRRFSGRGWDEALTLVETTGSA